MDKDNKIKIFELTFHTKEALAEYFFKLFTKIFFSIHLLTKSVVILNIKHKLNLCAWHV